MTSSEVEKLKENCFGATAKQHISPNSVFLKPATSNTDNESEYISVHQKRFDTFCEQHDR